MTIAKAQILIADDDMEDRLLVRLALQEARCDGIEVREFKNGKELLEHMKVLPAEPDAQPRLLLLDLNMPGIDGVSALKTMRQLPAFEHIPVVIFSTGIQDKIVNECLELGAREYVPKPANFDTFVSQMTSFVQRYIAGPGT